MVCVQPQCMAIYCVECFQDLDGTCPICMQPVDYGDFSDISEELYVFILIRYMCFLVI